MERTHGGLDGGVGEFHRRVGRRDVAAAEVGRERGGAGSIHRDRDGLRVRRAPAPAHQPEDGQGREFQASAIASTSVIASCHARRSFPVAGARPDRVRHWAARMTSACRCMHRCHAEPLSRNAASRRASPVAAGMRPEQRRRMRPFPCQADRAGGGASPFTGRAGRSGAGSAVRRRAASDGRAAGPPAPISGSGLRGATRGPPTVGKPRAASRGGSPDRRGWRR